MKTVEQAAREYFGLDSTDPNFTHTVDDERDLSIFSEGVKFAQAWISVDDEFPKSLKVVLIKCLSDSGKSYTTMAQFVKAHTVNADDFYVLSENYPLIRKANNKDLSF